MEKGHKIILDNYLDLLRENDINNILDAGSGRTSLATIIQNFPKATIDAVI